MKYAFIISLLMFLSPNLFAQPGLIVAPTESVFVPKGFDDNDSVEVVVSGYLPTTCYSRHQSKAEVNGNEIEITITAILQKSTTGEPMICPTVIKPFKEEVSLGLLKPGVYNITVNKGSKHELKNVIEVLPASTGLIDDHVYLNVHYIERLGKTKFKIKGFKHSYCLEVDKVQVISNDKDTLSVLPIMKLTSSLCPMKMTPVVIETEIDLDQVPAREVLLHVRTLDGKSVNKIINKEIDHDTNLESHIKSIKIQ